MRAVGVFMVGAVVSVSTAALAFPASDAVPATTGSIAFVRTGEDGRDVGEICVINPDRSSERRLRRSRDDEFSPVWSPDARKIVYRSRGSDGVTHVHVVNRNGSGNRQLTDYRAGFAESVAWSHNGRRIAYVRISGDFRTSDIYVTNANGTGRRRITRMQIREAAVTWSATGRLAFVRFPANEPHLDHGEIWVMDPDGSGQRRLTRNRLRDDGPAWSPDGSRLAFLRDVSERDCVGFPKRAVFLMRADGSGTRRLGPAIQNSGDSDRTGDHAGGS